MLGKRDIIILSMIGICVFYILFFPYNFHVNPQYSTRYYSVDNRVIDIAPIKRDERVQIPIENLNELPPLFIQCLLATEDKDFFNGILYYKDGKHSIDNIRLGEFRGIPIIGFARSMLSFGTKGGGSGLLQQLAKNLMHESWARNFQQKFSENAAVIGLTSSYNKEELLLMYFNNVPLMLNSDGKIYKDGSKTYGFKSALIRYYGTSNFNEIGLDKFAVLVASLKGGKYSNIDSIGAIKQRRDFILGRMAALGMITDYEVKKYSARAIKFNFGYKYNSCMRGAIEYVQQQAIAIAKECNLDTTLSGYKIHTTLSRVVQNAAAEAVKEYAIKNKAYRYFDNDTLELGMTIINPRNGHLLGMIGDIEPYEIKGKLNHAYRDKNSIGSTIKPFVYGAFFDAGYTKNTLLYDGDNESVGAYNPNNFSGTCSNTNIPAITCLSKSLNKPTANIVNEYISYVHVIKFVENCGYSGNLTNDRSVVLGVDYLSTLDMCKLYAPFANGGTSVPVIGIERIVDGTGKELWNIQNQKNNIWSCNKGIISYSVAKEVNLCLIQTIESGSAIVTKNYFKGKAAGKTGTSNNNRDTWFVGYTPTICTAVWIGGIKNKKLPKPIESGSLLAAPLWATFMQKVIQKDKKGYYKKDWFYEKPI